MKDLLYYLENTNMFLLIFQISFLSLIIYLVITDDRFFLNRKFIFIIIIILLIILSVYIEKAPYLIIKDLFWYSLVLNGSFIFHVLILDRIFHWCWKNHYEYLGFVVSRISFTISLWGIYYLVKKFRIYLYSYHDFREYRKIINRYKNDIEGQKLFKYRYALFYINYINDTKIRLFLINIYFIPLTIIKIILLHFITLFHNYSLILMGKSNNNFTLNTILRYTLFFTIFFSIAYLIGVPRLYIVWIFQLIMESYNILNHEYEHINSKEEFQKLEVLDKIRSTIKNYNKTEYLINCLNKKYEELEKIYEEPYHTFFLFDLYKFLRHKYHDGWSRGIWTADDTIYINKNGGYNKELKFPIIKIYEFYPWEEMAIGYCKAEDLVFIDEYDESAKRSEAIRLLEAVDWCKRINRGQELLLKIIPDLIKPEALPISEEVIEIIKKKSRYKCEYDIGIWIKNS